MKKLLVFFLILFSACSGDVTKETKVLLVSFDGFRYDYLNKTDTPNFDKLVGEGVKSEGLIPVFPSVTFPNYYAIATGLYPENNGFVGNSMFDESIGSWFSMGDRDQVENPDWYFGEPIWNTVEKNGKKAGTMFWVGSEAPIQNMRPTFWKRYDGSMPNKDRIDSVLNWMSLPNDNQIDFGTLYFSFVDGTGHSFGPDSQEIIQAIQQADSLIGYLVEEMQSMNLYKNTNLIIVADHGMAQLSRERIIYFDQMIDVEGIDIQGWGTNFMANGDENAIDELYQRLKAREDKLPYKVFKKEQIPDEYGVKNSERFPDLVAMAESGYLISTREYVESRENYATGGAHGFDNKEKDMQGIFIATGPDFKSGFTMPAFEGIQIYELIAHLLNVESAGTDGDLSVTEVMLKK